MKSKLILCLALVLSGCSFCKSVHAENVAPFLLFSTNSPQIYSDPTEETNWHDIKITLYRDSGETSQLDAKCITIQYGTNSWTEENVVALVDPKTGNAWVGSLGWHEPYFFLETKTNIVCGGIIGMAVALGAPRGAENEFNGAAANVGVQWIYSLLSNLKRDDTATSAVKELAGEIREYGSWRKLSNAKFFQHRKQQQETPLPASKRGNNGINPWLFLPNQKDDCITIEAIHFKDETLHLDLSGPDGIHPDGETGVHTANVWIDVKTLEVTKIIQDGKP
jgi:hypothetical protein